MHHIYIYNYIMKSNKCNQISDTIDVVAHVSWSVVEDDGWSTTSWSSTSVELSWGGGHLRGGWHTIEGCGWSIGEGGRFAMLWETYDISSSSRISTSSGN